MKWTALCLGLTCCLVACRQETGTESGSAHQQANISMQRIAPEASGVNFNNTLNDQGNLNVFIWNFLYTGSGVATGDLNDDGLPEIFFGGNQVADRLYLNKGDFRFEDITEAAGILENNWTTGVTMADVNGDGLLDIYVCRSSPTLRREVNRNKLYINQGDLQFVEQAAAYGLADEGFSIQATFFDADQDGDLDVYLINQPLDQLAQLINSPDDVARYPSSDKFYRNDRGQFIDVTEEMGLTDDRYGLGISLGDFDDNGWTDIYLCNDYTQADRLYMNRGGTFTDEIRERTGHISYYSMGSDAGDVNNDGWEDVFVLDMAFEDHYRAKTNMESMQPELFWSLVESGQHYPYAQNTMQLNRGDGYFTEVAQIGGLSRTDWSWSALLLDLDQDAMQDLVVTNGIMRDMKNNDFTQWVKEAYQGRVGPTNYLEVLAQLPSNPIANKIYQNVDGLRYREVTQEAGFGEPGFSHGLAYADLDGDGDLDLVENNMNAPAGIFRNDSRGGNALTIALIGPGSNTHGLGTPVRICVGGKWMARTMQTTRGYFSASVPELHFGLGNATQVDSVVVIWNARAQTILSHVPANQRLEIAFHEAQKMPFSHRQEHVIRARGVPLPSVHQEQSYDDYAAEVLLPYKLSQNGPFISDGDLNGDGLTDLFVGGAAGQPGIILEQRSDQTFHPTGQPALERDAPFEDLQSVCIDIDLDGDLDLYVVSGSNEFPEGSDLLRDRVYLNDGKGLFVEDADALPGDLRINGQCVVSLDFDRDGDEDLFVGGRLVAGNYAVPPASVFLVNDRGRFVDQTTEVLMADRHLGMITDGCATDLDGDGDADLVLVGEWMAPTILFNEDGKFTVQVLDDPGSGLWWTIKNADIDNDGDPDFVLGNLGWNQKFGGEHPKLEVYAADFDDNGDHDVVLAKQVGETELPYRGRECSSEEMPFILSKFPTYDAFAKARLSDILGEDKLMESIHRKISTLSSVCLVNEGGGTFRTMILPREVQTGVLRAIGFGDFNEDGNPDFLYAGNHFPVEVETARYDGLLHGVCFGDGHGGFTAKVLSSSEVPLMGDYRDVCLLRASATVRAILAANDGPLVEYRFSSPQ